MGSIKLVFNFPYNGGAAFTGDEFYPGVNLTGDPTLKYDLLVDPSSAHDAFGLYGFMQMVSRETDGYNWGNQAGLNLPNVAGTWETFSIPTAATGGSLAMTATRPLTYQLYGGGSEHSRAGYVVVG